MKNLFLSLFLFFSSLTLSSFTISSASFTVDFDNDLVVYYGRSYELVEVTCKIHRDHRVISYRCIDESDGFPRCVIFKIYDYDSGKRRIVAERYAN